MTSPNQLSFLPDDYLERKTQRRTNVICAVLFAIVLSAISAAFMLTERSLRVVEKRHAEVEKQYTEAAKRIEQARQVQEKQRTMMHQAELTSSLLEKVQRSRLLAGFTNQLPSGVSLLDLTMESRKVAAPLPPAARTMYEERKQQIEAEKRAALAGTEPKKYDVIIRLTGVAPSDVQVAKYIAALNQVDLLTDVNLVIVEQAKLGDEPVRKFQLEMRVNPNAETRTNSPDSLKTASINANAAIGK